MSSAGSYGGGGGGGGVGNVKFLTGNTGGPVGPDLVGNINVLGSGDINVAGNAGTNTLTISLSGAIADTYDADVGSAVPAAGILNIDGGSGISTFASGNTVVISLSGSGIVESIVGDTGSPISGNLTITGGTSGASFDTTGTTITESFNYLNMPYTNGAGTQGVIKFAGAPIFGFYGGVGNFNMFLGDTAGNTSLTGSNNIGLGPIAIHAVTSGFANVGVGPLALSSCTTGNSNVAMGLDALQNLTTGFGNVAVGYQPLQNLISGIDNVAFGIGVGSNYTGSESSNILISNAGVAAESHQIRIGTQGSSAGQQNACNIAGIFGSTVGGTNAAVFIDNAGNLGTAGGAGLVTSITGDSGGALTGAITITGGLSGAVYTGSGGNTLTTTFNYINMPFTNIAGTQGVIKFGGADVLGFYGGVGENNVLLGDGAGAAAMSGSKNTGVGSQALNGITSGADNTAFGYNALNVLTTGGNNTAVGEAALFNLVTGQNNIAIGNGAGANYTSTESSNIVIGTTGTIADANQIRIGLQGSGGGEQDKCNIAGIYGSTVGGTNAAVFIDNAGNLGTVGGSGGGGVSSLTGSGGGGALTGALTLAGGASGAVYTGSGTTITTTFTKLNMTYTNGAGTQGVIQFGGTNIFGFYGGAGQNNTYLGDTAGNTGVSTTGNTGIGANTQFSNTTGTDNTSIGNFSLSGVTSANFNTALGALALQHVTTGGSNTCAGFQAGSAYTGAEANNTCIGAGVTGTLGESNAIHIGDAGSSTSCFIGGIAGVTVASSAAVLINTGTNQLGTVPSSRRFKENISDMGSASTDIYKLRPVKFNFKGDYAQSYGLIAEDVEEVMPYLVSYDKEGLPATVRYHELPSLLLNEIQRLKLKIEELEGKFNARVRP